MFPSFYQKSQQKSDEQETTLNKLAIRLVQHCLKIQEKWATFLQSKTNKLSCRIKMVGFVFFCLLSGGYSIYLVTHNFTRHSQKANLFSSIKFFSPVSQTKIKNLPPAIVISPEEFKTLQRLQHWQDSLSRKSSGEHIQDTFSGSASD